MFLQLNSLNLAYDMGKSDFGAQLMDMEGALGGPHFSLINVYFTIGGFYIRLKLSWGDYGYPAIREMTVMQVADLRDALAKRRENG